ncbi:MAG: Rrf2 family transcriptional regulator [Elusimicrobiaceae bacterium]|nr:Rrf2 family transcriptional regulator [Elusimicrobiaceae bacterium]
MNSILRISDAAVLALHACILLAKRPCEPQSVQGLADRLGVSAAHLSKVLQRLVRAGVLISRRGPGGGFLLADRAARIRLLKIYEIIEGKPRFDECLLGKMRCRPGTCLLGDFLHRTALELGKMLSVTLAVAAGRASLGE